MVDPPNHWLFRPLLVWFLGVLLSLTLVAVLLLYADSASYWSTVGLLLRIGGIWISICALDAFVRAKGGKSFLRWKRQVQFSTASEPVFRPAGEIEAVALLWLLTGLIVSSVEGATTPASVAIALVLYLPSLTVLIVWGLYPKA